MIFSILALLTLCISICIKNRNKSLKIQSINCLCAALYDLTITAYTGAVLGFINFIRSSLFINREKFSKSFYLALLIIFEGLVVSNCAITWCGIISLIPTVASIVRTYCLWQTNMKYVRLSGVLSGALFTIYYIYYQSWFMIIGYLLLLIVSFYQVYKVDFKQTSVELSNAK